jgi:hypothetical protein
LNVLAIWQSIATWWYADDSPENTREMSVVGKSDREGHFRQGMCGSNQAFCLLNAKLHLVRVWRKAIFLSEQAKQMERR